MWKKLRSLAATVALESNMKRIVERAWKLEVSEEGCRNDILERYTVMGFDEDTAEAMANEWMAEFLKFGYAHPNKPKNPKAAAEEKAATYAHAAGADREIIARAMGVPPKEVLTIYQASIDVLVSGLGWAAVLSIPAITVLAASGLAKMEDGLSAAPWALAALYALGDLYRFDIGVGQNPFALFVWAFNAMRGKKEPLPWERQEAPTKRFAPKNDGGEDFTD